MEICSFGKYIVCLYYSTVKRIMTDKIIDIIKRNWSYLVGFLVGGLGGYLYWYNIGCTTGTCPITSSPTYSMIWGALMGALLLNIIFGKTKK